jgi:hypothetical protein
MTYLFTFYKTKSGKYIKGIINENPQPLTSDGPFFKFCFSTNSKREAPGLIFFILPKGIHSMWQNRTKDKIFVNLTEDSAQKIVNRVTHIQELKSVKHKTLDSQLTFKNF